MDSYYFAPEVSEYANYSTQHIGSQTPTATVRGTLFSLHNPIGHFSILPPDGGCANNSRTLSSTTAKEHNCLAATNAGFFNVDNGTCIGNLVSNSQFIQSSDWYNPIFAIRGESVVVGYLGRPVAPEDNFSDVVSGVIWLVRNGESNVQNAIEVEDPWAQTTGSLSYFASVLSARTAIGVNKNGEIMIASMEGKTGTDGINLFDFADFLIELGFDSAINLDGGGSATAVDNDVLVDFPSDSCPNAVNGHHILYCERQVTSITCIHDSSIDSPLESENFDQHSPIGPNILVGGRCRSPPISHRHSTYFIDIPSCQAINISGVFGINSLGASGYRGSPKNRSITTL